MKNCKWKSAGFVLGLSKQALTLPELAILSSGIAAPAGAYSSAKDVDSPIRKATGTLFGAGTGILGGVGTGVGLAELTNRLAHRLGRAAPVGYGLAALSVPAVSYLLGKLTGGPAKKVYVGFKD